MTPEVIEVRMKTPRPDLLRLLARPELAIFRLDPPRGTGPLRRSAQRGGPGLLLEPLPGPVIDADDPRSEEHTSELQSLMRISYAVFCLKKKKRTRHEHDY